MADEEDVTTIDADEEIGQDEPLIERAEDDGRTRAFPCRQCGADLEWKPGQASLSCPYCGFVAQLPTDERAIVEYDLNDHLQVERKPRGLGIATRPQRCGGCGAQVDFDPQVSARECPYCGGALIDDTAHDDRIAPEALIAFTIERDRAREQFRAWLKSRWFAPGKLAERAVADRFQGVYRAWWTFDSRTLSHWSGQAGHYYYVTRTRTVNGKTQTYRERKTRWVRRSGTYECFYDDWLTPGFRSGLETAGYRLEGLQPYRGEALAGFVCERYEIDPQGAWARARNEIESDIRDACQQRLRRGADTSRGLHVDTAHTGITFKSVLLPAWMTTYRYNGKTYRVSVNGQTGSVTAERPYSWIKITLLVLAIIAVVLAVVLLIRTN